MAKLTHDQLKEADALKKWFFDELKKLEDREKNIRKQYEEKKQALEGQDSPYVEGNDGQR